MRTLRNPKILAVMLLAMLAVPARDAHAGARPILHGTVEQLLGLGVHPFAIAHRGFGDNLGEDRTRPIENTVPAVEKAFKAGATVVEVDVQLTRDGQIAVFHDDFLPDFTCLNTLTLAELQHRVPWVPSLQAVLNQARRFNQASGPLRGLLIVELKAAAPLCDPDDTQEQAIVTAVTQIIRRLEMSRQVMLTSLSPALLYLAQAQAPEITRILTVSGLQFFTAAEIEAALHLPVRPIDKVLGLGLQWADVGPLYRLPGYRSPGEILATAAITGARVVEADLLLLGMVGAPFVEAVHAVGLRALGFTATTPAEWLFLQSLGLDGIYTNDVPFGLTHEAPIP
jgi:glycerophosphoryl diester phosphodiesterase